MATVVLAVTGSISAYKACEIVRLLVKDSIDVRVAMTDAATKFVTPLTFQTLSKNPVSLDPFVPFGAWEPGHIALATRADVYAVAPATADVIAKLANGLADDIVTSTALATRAPLLIAPAMNTLMWEHPATQANVETLRKRGATFVEAAPGELACGATGKGRLAEPAAVVQAIQKLLKRGD